MALPIPIPKFKAAEPVPFTEAIQWFRQQAPWISGSSWNTMASLAALKGDQISGTVLLSMLDDVWGQMDRAVAEGKPYGDFVRDVAKVLDARWYQADSARLRLIYHNNVGSALMAGREAQMSDPAVVEARPFVLFDGIGDWRQTVDICKPRDGTILPADDPWWKENSPLLHHGCRSGKVTLDEEDARELGGLTDKRKLEGIAPAQQGWGKPASWTDWTPSPANYHPALMAEYLRWTQGQEYIHQKSEWDAKWQREAAAQKFAADAAAAIEAEAIKLKSLTAELNDPTKAISWGKEARYDGLKLNGIPIQPAVDGYWDAIPDVPTGEPDLPTEFGKISTGLLVLEDDGRVWVVEPKDHFGGYEHTFPKGKLDANLTAQQNALKEVYEEAGLSAEITGYIGDFKGTTGVTRYYVARRTGGQPWTAHWESQAVKLIPVQEADQYLNTDRDREVLAVLMAKKTGTQPPPGLKTYVEPPKPKPVVTPDVATIAEPANAYPFGLDPAKYSYGASKPGGATAGLIAVHPDAPGEKFLVKQLNDPLKANAEVAGGNLYGLVSSATIGVELVDPDSLPASIRGGGRYVTIQKMEPGVVGLTSVVGYKGNPDYTKLTTDQQAELIAHGIASWIAGEHDGHAEQYLLKNGQLIRIDLGQALRYTLTEGDELSLDYHPNERYGEARPAHMQLLKAIKDGQIDSAVLHHPAVKAAAEKASQISEATLEKALGAYGDLRPGGKSKAEIVKLLKQRSENVKKDWGKLFKQVTGKTYKWDAEVKQRAPRKPRVSKQVVEESRIPKMALGVNIPAATPALETFGATTVLADGDKLRGQAWRVQRADIVGPGGKEASHTITGELDQSLWAGLEQTIRAKGGKPKQWESYARVGLFDPSKDTARSAVKQFDMVKATGFLGNALVYEDPDLNFRVTFASSNSQTAMQGKIKIEVFSGDAKEAQRLMAKALEELNLDQHSLASTPTPESVTLARANRALWNLEGGSYRPAQTAEDALNRLEAHGVDPKKLTAKQNSIGYEEPVIEGRWKEFRKSGARYLYHQFRPEDAPLRGISGADGGKGGIFSTVARVENGIVIEGMSSSEDLRTGGASSTFTRLVGKKGTDAGRSWYSDYNYTAILSPQILDRLDWYGFTYDNYGRTNDSAFQRRDGAANHIKTVVDTGGRGNEIMLRNAVAREDILFFAVPTDYQRNNILATLTASGVKTIRGQPVEEMVVVMATPSDYSRLNAKNPVHAFLMGKKDACPEWTETYGDTK